MHDVAVRSGLRPTEASLNGQDDRASPDEGQAERTAKVLGMQLGSADNGVAVEGVSPDSDAGEKGLQTGDVILRAGDHATRAPHDVADAAAEAKKAGRKEVLLLIARGGQQLFVPLKVEGQG
jgi:serine protease Do